MGKQIVSEFPVYNHNPFWGNDYVGMTSNGIKLYLNKEIIFCDCIIALGTILPHINMGFSGGYKILLPGCSSLDTIKSLHKFEPNQRIKLWETEDNYYRSVIDEMNNYCPLDFLVNVILNKQAEIVDVFAGDPIAAFESGKKLAKKVYNSQIVRDSDIVIVNMFSRENESFVGQILGLNAIKDSGGTLVMIAESGIGQVTHYGTGNFGKFFKNENYLKIEKPEKLNKQIIFSSLPDRASSDWWLEDNDKIIWATTWDEVLKELTKDYPDGAKVTFIEDGGMQYDSSLNIEI